MLCWCAASGNNFSCAKSERNLIAHSAVQIWLEHFQQLYPLYNDVAKLSGCTAQTIADTGEVTLGIHRIALGHFFNYYK